MNHPWFLESFLCKQLILRLISSMSHKVKEQSRHRCQNKESPLSFAYNER